MTTIVPDYKIIRPVTITEDALLQSNAVEPDTGETPWSATEINATGEERYIGAPTFNPTIALGTPAVFTSADYNMADNTPMRLTTDGTLPTGFTNGNTYYPTRLTDDTFTLSATKNGRPIAGTGSQSGTHTIVAKVHKVYEALQGQKSTVTFDATADTVLWNDHPFENEDVVVATNNGGALPAVMTAGTPYYVRNKTASTFQLSATPTGTVLNFATAGTGTHTMGYAVNYNAHPCMNPEVWGESRPTNRWAMFDDVVGTATTADEELVVVLQPNARFDSLALLGAEAGEAEAWFEINRETVTFDHTVDKVLCTAHPFTNGMQVVPFFDVLSGAALPAAITWGDTYYVVEAEANAFKLSLTEGGAAIALADNGSGTLTIGELVWYRAMDLVDNSNVGDWEQYFYEEVYDADTVAQTELVDAATLELPAITDGILTVRLARDNGQVSMGELKIGMMFEIGETLSRPEAGILDYSVKETNTFGRTTLEERDFSRRQNVEVIIDSDNVDAVHRVLSAYRAKPIVIIGGTYGCLMMLGFFKDFHITPEQDGVPAIVTIKAEGLT